MAKRIKRRGPKGRAVAKKIRKWAMKDKKGRKLSASHTNYLRGAIAHKIQMQRRGGRRGRR